MNNDRNPGAPGLQGLQKLEKLAPHDLPVKKLGLMARLRNYFLTGLIVVGPVGITLYIVWTFINWVDSWVKPLLPPIWLPETYGHWIPGMGLVFSILMLTIVGALAANLFGRTIVAFGEQMLGRMPIVRGVYGALKQIFETVLSQSQNSFQKAALIEFPRKGLYSLVFVSTDTSGEILEKCGGAEKDMVSVFMPTTPNPTSGFLVFVHRRDVTMLDMKVEDAAKLIISAGLVSPEYQVEPLVEIVSEKPVATEPMKPAKRGWFGLGKTASGDDHEDRAPLA
jgi:uncharacterized membrane protein